MPQIQICDKISQKGKYQRNQAIGDTSAGLQRFAYDLLQTFITL